MHLQDSSTKFFQATDSELVNFPRVQHSKHTLTPIPAPNISVAPESVITILREAVLVVTARNDASGATKEVGSPTH